MSKMSPSRGQDWGWWEWVADIEWRLKALTLRRRRPGEGNGNPLQYSCLGNPMDRGTWPATVHGTLCVLKSPTQLSYWTTATSCQKSCKTWWTEHTHKTSFLSSLSFSWMLMCATWAPFRTESLFLPTAGSVGRGCHSAKSPSKHHKGIPCLRLCIPPGDNPHATTSPWWRIKAWRRGWSPRSHSISRAPRECAEACVKTVIWHRHREQTCGHQGGKGVGGMNRETGIDMSTLLRIKQITNENLLYSTGRGWGGTTCLQTYIKLTLKMHCNI